MSISKLLSFMLSDSDAHALPCLHVGGFVFECHALGLRMFLSFVLSSFFCLFLFRCHHLSHFFLLRIFCLFLLLLSIHLHILLSFLICFYFLLFIFLINVHHHIFLIFHLHHHHHYHIFFFAIIYLLQFLLIFSSSFFLLLFSFPTLYYDFASTIYQFQSLFVCQYIP